MAAAGVADIGEGRDARARARDRVDLRLQQAFAQFPQGLAAPHRRQQQPVGLQDLAELRERAGQIVDPVQGQGRDHEVEAARRERRQFRVADHPARGAGESERRIRRGHRRPMSRLREDLGQLTIAAAEFQHPLEPALDVVEPVDEPGPHLAHEKPAVRRQPRRPLAMLPHDAAVEDEDVAAHAMEYGEMLRCGQLPIATLPIAAGGGCGVIDFMCGGPIAARMDGGRGNG